MNNFKKLQNIGQESNQAALQFLVINSDNQSTCDTYIKWLEGLFHRGILK